MLYLVVHHRGDKQIWSNGWLDDNRIETIPTTAEVCRLCEEARERGERIFIHRCAWGDFEPVICCSATVERSEIIDRKAGWVTFGNHQILEISPPKLAFPGDNYYQAAGVI